jgi:UDP-MurNAc hydroxylase
VILRYLGHAGWSFEEDGFSIICDPWHSNEGAFYAAWFQFPSVEGVQLPARVDAIYVSHAHDDHFDPETLSRFPRNTPIVIADFNDPVLLRELGDLDFENVRILPDGELLNVGPFSIQIFRDEDFGMYHDSALMVRSCTGTVLNLNDCRLSDKYSDTLKPVDVLLGQFSGASWYPVAYDYPESRMKSISADKRRRGLERLCKNAALFGAAVTIPCAGPPAFLDPSLSHLNDIDNANDNPFPMADTAVEFLNHHGCRSFLSMPGDAFELRDKRLRLLDRTQSPEDVYHNRRKYLCDYAERKVSVIERYLIKVRPDVSTGEHFKRELLRVVHSSRVFVKQIGGVIRFELLGIDHADIIVDSTGDRSAVLDYDGRPVNYHFIVDHRFVAALLKRRYINFERVFLSMRFRAARSPDTFNPALFGLLVNFDKDRLFKAESGLEKVQSNDQGFFELIHGEKRYLVQRTCPHMAADLSVAGAVEGETLTCTRHGWRFRLRDGLCTNVRGAAIAVKLKS